MTVAWRYRNSPWIAAAGIAISAGSKTAGLLLAVPFVLSFRWRAISWAAAYIGVLAVTPVLLFHGVWQRYLDNGITAIRLNGERTDNASLLNAATKLAVPKVFVLAALAGAAVIVSIKARDTFWPATWLMVAALPVAWMYSLLTFLPLGIAAVRTGRTRPTVLVLLGLTFTIASPPLGFTATWMFPLVVALLLPVSGMTDESDFDIDWQRWLRRLPDSVRPRQMPTIAAMTDAS